MGHTMHMMHTRMGYMRMGHTMHTLGHTVHTMHTRMGHTMHTRIAYEACGGTRGCGTAD